RVLISLLVLRSIVLPSRSRTFVILPTAATYVVQPVSGNGSHCPEPTPNRPATSRATLANSLPPRRMRRFRRDDSCPLRIRSTYVHVPVCHTVVRPFIFRYRYPYVPQLRYPTCLLWRHRSRSRCSRRRRLIKNMMPDALDSDTTSYTLDDVAMACQFSIFVV